MYKLDVQLYHQPFTKNAAVHVNELGFCLLQKLHTVHECLFALNVCESMSLPATCVCTCIINEFAILNGRDI